MNELLKALVIKLSWLEEKLLRLEERVDVLDENTCTFSNRLEELEDWQVEADDKLDEL